LTAANSAPIAPLFDLGLLSSSDFSLFEKNDKGRKSVECIARLRPEIAGNS